MNQLVNPVKCLAGTLQKMTSDSGNYLSVNNVSLAIRGTLVLRDYEILDDDGTLTTLKSADWLFLTSDLAEAMPPQPGDEWVVEGETYHAMLLGNRPCFEAQDATRQMTVVHMKKVADA